MTSRRYIIHTISLLLCLPPAIKIVQACGGGDLYDDYTSFFRPAVAQRPAYIPFHYESFAKYYDEAYGFEGETAIPDPNLAEWKAFTGGVPEGDLDSFIYRYPYKDLSNLYFHLEKGSPLSIPGEMSGNKMTRWFMTGKDLETLGYLMYAKQCEPHVTAPEWEAPVRDTAKMGRLARNGMQLYNAAKKDFIKKRYAYQVLRLCFYAGRADESLELYPRLVADDASTDIISVRTLGLKAGALYRVGQKAEAAYRYSLVFDRSDAEKRSAYISYDWAVGQDVAPVLALCKTNHERAVVQVMDGLHEYGQGLPQLQAAYTLDPKVDGLDVLMIREINKMEERYLAPVLDDRRNIEASGWADGYRFGGYERGSTDWQRQLEEAKARKPYLQQLNAFAQKAAGEGKAERKAFWLLAASYLYFMDEDAPAGKRYLDMAARETMSPRERDLFDVINALYIVRRSGRITPAVEAELLPYLQSMDRRAAGSPAARKPYRDMLGTILTTAYINQQDTVRAIYTLGRQQHREDGGFYIDDSFMDLPGTLLERISLGRLQEVKAFPKRKDLTPYEQWLVRSTPYTTDMLLELEGTKHIRQHEFETAVTVLKQVSPTFPARTFPDPFRFRIRDIQELDDADTANQYTKLTFAQRMADIRRQLQKSPDDAALLMAYGTALYSMTYYGKAHNAFTYYRSSVDGMAYFNSEERQKLPGYLQEYYGASAAESSFLRAAAQAKDGELKARALYLAAQCWQKHMDRKEAFSAYGGDDDEKAYYLNSLQNPYFRQLKEGSRATAFYREAYGTCGYLKDYANQMK